MNILLVSHTFFPKYVGGTETVVLESAKELISRGHTVTILCTDPISQEEPYSLIKSVYNNIPVLTIHKNILKKHSYKDGYQDDEVIPIFKKILSDLKPDVIHYHHLMHLSLEMVQIAKKQNITQLFTLHDFWIQTPLFNRTHKDGSLYETFSLNEELKIFSDIPAFTKEEPHSEIVSRTNITYLFNKLLHKFQVQVQKNKYIPEIKHRQRSMREMLATVDYVVFPTLFLFQELCKWGFSANNVILADDGINTTVFKNFKKTPSTKTRFGFVGSIIPAKGLDILLNAWKQADTKNAELLIWGNLQTDKTFGKTVQELAKGQENIHFKGTFLGDEIKSVYEEIDILVVPSRWFENAPLVLRNAMHTHTPAIVTNLGSLPEMVIHEKTGYVFENENYHELAAMITKSISHLHKLQQNCKATPPVVSMEDHISFLENLYKTK